MCSQQSGAALASQHQHVHAEPLWSGCEFTFMVLCFLVFFLKQKWTKSTQALEVSPMLASRQVMA